MDDKAKEMLEKKSNIILESFDLSLETHFSDALENYNFNIINNYQKDIGTLRYCVSDVEAFRSTLIQVVGYKPRNVHLMTDQMSGQDLSLIHI